MQTPAAGTGKNFWFFVSGIFVLSTTILCLLWQSHYGGNGTSKGYSKYNLFHVTGEISEHAFSGNPNAVISYAKILLEENRLAAAKYWLNFFISRYPEESSEVKKFLQEIDTATATEAKQ